MRHNFKKLNIWQESMKLIDKTYKLTASFPSFEQFGLRSQMNRCAVSIASNIAEGTSKSSNTHFIHYLEMSLGSAFEWETQLNICLRQDYIEKNLFLDLEDSIKAIQSKISNFIAHLK